VERATLAAVGELVRGRSVEYESRGEGDAVLFIHGAIVADSFAPLMREEVLAGYRMIRYRRRGYGHSEPTSDPPTILEHARDALELLDELDVPSAHVVGHSGGGPIAVQLAVDVPDRVRSLVLLEPALQNAEMAAAFDQLVAPLVELHHAGETAKAVHLWMRTTGGPEWATEIEEQIPGSVEQANRDAAGTFDGDVPAMRTWDFDLVDTDRLTQPVLYLVGGRSFHRQETVDLFRSRVPQCETVVVPDADHNLQAVRATAVAEELADFFRRQA
jgi:pimeloyl-ACP methyl ester carboxylesterase